MFDFNESVVIVTGASGNLGSAVSQAFHQAGARLVLVDKSAERLARLDRGPLSNGHHLAQGIDVNDPASVREMGEEVVRRLGRIDVLVNTVGGYQAGTPVHETPLDVWDRMMSLNARTAFIVSQAVVPQMLRQGSGKIINIAARPGLVGAANAAAYSARNRRSSGSPKVWPPNSASRALTSTVSSRAPSTHRRTEKPCQTRRLGAGSRLSRWPT